MFYYIGGELYYEGYQFLTENQETTSTKKVILKYPPVGKTLSNVNQFFDWTPADGSHSYRMTVGTEPLDLNNNTWYNVADIHTRDPKNFATVKGIPLNGNPIYVIFWYMTYGMLNGDLYIFPTENVDMKNVKLEMSPVRHHTLHPCELDFHSENPWDKRSLQDVFPLALRSKQKGELRGNVDLTATILKTGDETISFDWALSKENGTDAMVSKVKTSKINLTEFIDNEGRVWVKSEAPVVFEEEGDFIITATPVINGEPDGTKKLEQVFKAVDININDVELVDIELFPEGEYRNNDILYVGKNYSAKAITSPPEFASLVEWRNDNGYIETAEQCSIKYGRGQFAKISASLGTRRRKPAHQAKEMDILALDTIVEHMPPVSEMVTAPTATARARTEPAGLEELINWKADTHDGMGGTITPEEGQGAAYEASYDLTVLNQTGRPYYWYILNANETMLGGDVPVCGDSLCNFGETCSTCALDCGTCPPVCGNGICETGETCSTCVDCGECPPFCGDYSCNGTETCSTCQYDCGPCLYCGDSICSAFETCTSCQLDCGSCPTEDLFFKLVDPKSWPMHRSNPYVYEVPAGNVTNEMITHQNDENSGVNPDTVNDDNFEFKMKRPGQTTFTLHNDDTLEYERETFRDATGRLGVIIYPLIGGQRVTKQAGTYVFKFWNDDDDDDPYGSEIDSGVRDFAMNMFDFLPNTQEPEEFARVTVQYINNSGVLILNGTPVVDAITQAIYDLNE